MLVSRNSHPTALLFKTQKNPRDGRFLEIVGFYNPRTEPGSITIDEARVFEWMSNGAKPTESVAKLFRTTGTADRFARFKKGEPVATLTEEAKAAEVKRSAPATTNR